MIVNQVESEITCIIMIMMNIQTWTIESGVS